MTTSNETSDTRYAKEAKSVPIEISYGKSATNPEQHSLPSSIALHLLPGILTGATFFLIAPITQRNGLPSLWALGIADLLVILPFIYGLLFYQGYKRNGRPHPPSPRSRATG